MDIMGCNGISQCFQDTVFEFMSVSGENKSGNSILREDDYWGQYLLVGEDVALV